MNEARSIFPAVARAPFVSPAPACAARNTLVGYTAGADDCSEVTNQDLAGRTSLYVNGNASHATAGDYGPGASVVKRHFVRLDALTPLSLTNHDITGLANNVFDHVEDTLTTLSPRCADRAASSSSP